MNVETLNGHVYCETIQANASIKTNGGIVIAKRIAANYLRVDTGNGGNIHIDSVFVHDCELQANKGNIIAKKNFRASGKTKCASNGGDIMLENVECGDEDAEVTVDAKSTQKRWRYIDTICTEMYERSRVYEQRRVDQKRVCRVGSQRSSCDEKKTNQTKSSFPRRKRVLSKAPALLLVLPAKTETFPLSVLE